LRVPYPNPTAAISNNSITTINTGSTRDFTMPLFEPISLPHVEGTAIPTVAAALVDAISALGHIKKPASTHHAFAKTC